MKLPKIFRASQYDESAHMLYQQIVRQARQPVFFLDFAVPDTMEGRFDMIALHAFLVMRRLKDGAETSAALSQTLFDLMFADMDENLREMGVGDLMVGKKVRKLAESFMGRIAAYEEGLEAEAPEVLEGAVIRNIYRDGDHPAGAVSVLAAHTRDQEAHLAQQAVDELLKGQVSFMAAPTAVPDAAEPTGPKGGPAQ